MCRAKSYDRLCRTTTHLNTPFEDLNEEKIGKLIEVNIIDPRHPLFGRRFPLSSKRESYSLTKIKFIDVLYKKDIILRIPILATDLLGDFNFTFSKLTRSAVEEFVSLAQESLIECRINPTKSGID